MVSISAMNYHLYTKSNKNKKAENKRNSYMYFTYLFEELPNANMKSEAELRKYLPYSERLADYTKTLSKSELKAILSGQIK